MEAEFPLVGLAGERQRLGEALDARESLLMLGPPGCGKTRLLTDALRERKEWLYVEWDAAPHRFLVSLSRALMAAGHDDFARRAAGADAQVWLGGQTSVRLRGLLWSALERTPLPLAIDEIRGAGFAAYRFLRRLRHARGMAVVGAARGAHDLGALSRLFWEPERTLRVAPLEAREAARLFDAAADRFRLGSLALDEFREKVLEEARGNPGQIIEMCRLATEPRYLAGRHVKFGPLRIDAFTRFRESAAAANSPAARRLSGASGATHGGNPSTSA
jgi:hypothetical protein